MSNLAGIIASTLRPWPVTAPAITLSATFPSNLHVGDTGSFVVTATEADGATGSLTITVDTLPDGMTLGSTTDNGDGTFSATVSYDLTTEQDVTASFSATGGSVAATALVHEFAVQAASASAPYIVHKAKAIGTGNKSVTISFVDPTTGTPWTPTAGHMLTALVATNGSGTLATPSGWTLIDSRFLNAAGIAAFRRPSDGTETSVTFTGSANALSGVVLEIAGQNGSAPINAHDVAQGGIRTSDLPTLTPTVGKCLAIGAAAWQQPGTSATYSVSSGWAIEASTSPAFFGVCVVSQTLDDSLAAVTGTVTIGSNGNQSSTLMLLIQP